MKAINILSLVQAFNSLNKNNYMNFSAHHGIGIKDDEVVDLTQLVTALNHIGSVSVFDSFYVGYKIPQIGKEFDLLRIGKNYAVNIELKRNSSEEKILKQLRRNYYYLGSIGKPVYCFCFIAGTGNTYYYNDKHEIRLVNLADLHTVLEKQIDLYFADIDNFFDPSNYLVSPFNSTERFVLGQYFLTHQQEEIRLELINIAGDESKPRFISITGSAGTGKTLLVYDFVKEMVLSRKKVLVIHCGKLNSGHYILNSKYNWGIASAKNCLSYILSSYSVIVIDEAQRIYPNQLEKIVGAVQSSSGMCVLSYDKAQTLSSWEERRNIDDYVQKIVTLKKYELTDKIRTNKALSSFIKALFNRGYNSPKIDSENVILNYFNNIESAKSFLMHLRNQSWTVLRFTPSRYTSSYHDNYSDPLNPNSHEVIGQEFDNVAVVIDSLFSYDINGDLIYAGGSYYHPVKMLFQNITRTRKKLNIVIVQNEHILDRCMSVLSG
ncbi:ATP-binding protein [Rheinheimera sediminis]|uniref:ATP-binding protein n=1 Tax=Rheinheimera sp. YQF-1 TaxID=2499626 RepID=UPI000FD6F89B|nr:ATP-binding protein [Rheinheimera sp. YQF-1]RVT48609.1 ATP-binding protein [Rheinheimera sp. YQF-1]